MCTRTRMRAYHKQRIYIVHVYDSIGADMQHQGSIVSYFSSSTESSRVTDPVDSDIPRESTVTSGSASEREEAPTEKQTPPKAKCTCHSAPARHWKHRTSGFDSAWCKEYTWLEVVRENGGKIQGMICRLCRDYGRPPRSGSGVWSKVMCTSFCKDKRNLHAKSSMHKAARLVYMERQHSVTVHTHTHTGLSECTDG